MDEFSRKLIGAVTHLKIGSVMESGLTQGPLIDVNVVEKVEAHIANAIAKRGEVLCGGKRHMLGQSFFKPIVIKGLSRDAHVVREETFGTLAPLFAFRCDDEMIALANDTEVGLASYLHIRGIGRIWRIAEALEYRMVSINTGLISK